MNKFDCTMSELVNMLVTMEGTLKSSRGTILIVEWTSSKRKSTGKKKIKFIRSRRWKTGQRRKFLRRPKQKESSSTVMLKAIEGETVHCIWRA